MHVQPFEAYRPVITLDVSIVRWLTRLKVHHRDLLLVGPIDQCRAQVLRPVVTTDSGGLAALLNDLFQRPDHAQ